MNKTKSDFLSKYTATIGLEIHAELNTRTKMFCNSKNDPEETRPNVNVCPVCMGHPGTLPTINKEAVKNILKIGLAVDGQIADFTEFDRKNYFYPDIPKGYQISQYEHPLVSGGKLAGINITRIHLEEDTARSIHPENVEGVQDGEGFSLVNFNRAGVPLMELVTDPVITSGEQALMFARELQLLLRTLKIGNANMEKGEMRVEANISIRSNQEFNSNAELGTKVEVKNLNSFRSVARAIDYEISRQAEMLKNNGNILQETRGWDEIGQTTFSQRVKEEADDYRYFPDPDLPKLKISEIPEFGRSALLEEMPVLPWDKREFLTQKFSLKPEEVEFFVSNFSLCDFFEDTTSSFSDDINKIKLAANYIISDLNGLLNKENLDVKDISISSEDLATIIEMNVAGEISSRGAKNILLKIFEDGGSPREVAEREGFIQKSDESELSNLVDRIIEENAKAVEQYRSGKEESMKFLIGQGMKASKGSANPQVLEKILREKIG